MIERVVPQESRWRKEIIQVSRHLESLKQEGAQHIIGLIRQIREIRESGKLGRIKSLIKSYDFKPSEPDNSLLSSVYTRLIKSLSKAVGIINYKAEADSDQYREWARLTLSDGEGILLKFYVSTHPGVVIESRDLNLRSALDYLSSMKSDYGLMITERFVSFFLGKIQESSSSRA